MSTRGMYGIRKDGIEKVTYNHSDSYPSWLGEAIAQFCANSTEQRLEKFFDSIEVVKEDDHPTPEQAKFLAETAEYEFAVKEGYDPDWYSVLRNIQGDFAVYGKLIDGGKTVFITDGTGFIKDSAFCEYAYIINLDENVLEFYKGFQNEPDSENRYGEEKDPDNGLYPCKMLSSFDLDKIKTEEDIERIIAVMESGLREDEYEAYKDLVSIGLTDEEAKECIKKGYTDVTGVFEDSAEIAVNYVENLYDVDGYVSGFIDYESMGQNMVNNSDEYKELESGRIIISNT